MSQGADKPRIRVADDVRSSSITSHKLVAQQRQVASPDRLAWIESRIGPGRCRVKNRDQLSVRIYPISEISLTVLERWD